MRGRRNRSTWNSEHSQSDAAESAQRGSTAPTNGAPTAATHVLVGTRALPLRGAEVDLGSGFRLRLENDHWTLHGDGALINGIPATPVQPLALGDTLFLGTAGHGRMIEVRD